MILVDTSVWIDFLRGRSNWFVDVLERIIDEGEAAICEVVFAEICYGSKDESQFKKYSSYFSYIPMLTLESGWEKEIARMGFKARRSGHKLFTADLMIARAAIQHEVPLFTKDKDFLPFKKLFGLSLL